MKYEAVLTETIHEEACNFLLKHVREGRRQEELCFALWRPSTGATRESALIFEIVLPRDNERDLHGNVSFDASYLTRAIRLASSKQAGLAFMHNHFGPGWQGMSEPDVIAERDRISPPARASGLPLVGLTLGSDCSWSARFWTWDNRQFNRSWCDKVRVVGRKMRITFNDRLMPPPERQPALRRTIDTWGKARQRDIARLRVGIVGVGSVGCMVAEALARIGVENLVLIDPDKIETHNLDRLLYATHQDIGKHKVQLASDHLKHSATAANFKVQAHAEGIQTESCYLAALDCDVLFSAVDRPLPKDLLNRIAYSHCIPVISGGVFIDNKSNGTMGQAAWSVVTAGPVRRCLRCDGQYTTSDVTMERDGSLDDPSYIAVAKTEGDTPTNQNVFPFSANLASFMVIEMIRLIVAESWWPDAGGKLHYTLIPNRLTISQEACTPSCSVCAKTMHGDQDAYPFIVKVCEDSTRSALRKLLGSAWNRLRVLLRNRRHQ